MRVWTNGSFARIWVKDKIFRLRRGAVTLEETVKAVKGALDGAPDEIVAWAPTGARLDSGLEKKRRRVIDARALDEDRVAGIIKEGRGAPRLVVGPPAGPYDLELTLTAEGTRVSWPEGTIWPDGPPWDASETFVGVPTRGIRLHANRRGIGIAAATSGHVAVLRPDATELSFVLRVPGQEEARLDAVPTREGVLVTLVVEGQKGGIFHFDEAGKLLGRWPETHAMGAFPALCLDDERVLAFDQESEALALLSMPDLDELTREEISDQLVEAAATSKGDIAYLADANNAYEVQIDGESLSIDGPFELAADEPLKGAAGDVVSRYDAARATGPTQVAFPTEKQSADPPWEVERDKELRITMRVRSAARPGRGVEVELGGAAMKQGLLQGVSVEIDGARVPFETAGGAARAVLPDFELPVGLEWPLDPKPKNDDEKAHAKVLVAATHFTVEILIAGAKAGSGLLSIAIGACDTSAAPLKRMRPVTVS